MQKMVLSRATALKHFLVVTNCKGGENVPLNGQAAGDGGIW
jgi:hypothetical protein